MAGKCRRPRTRYGTSPEAADYFWVSSEATPSRGSQTVAPRPTPTPRLPEDGVQGAPPGTPPPRCHGSELGLGSHAPGGGGNTGGALFCASGFAGLLNRRRNATGFICISSLPALKALARSHLHRTQPIGGRLRAKNANSNDMSGRGPPVGYANTLSLSPAGDTQPPAHHTWLFGPDVLSGGRGG